MVGLRRGAPAGAVVLLAASAAVAAPPPASRYDLSGEWTGAFNVTDGPTQTERVMIYQSGDNLRAVKITGDRNVPAGKETFHAVYSADRFPGQQQCAGIGFTHPSWSPMTVVVKDATHFQILGACGMAEADWSRLGKPTLALDDAILFDTAKFVLKPEASHAIDDMAALIAAKHPKARLTVNGFTDDVGGDAYNRGLSKKRARSVADALAARGVARARLAVEGYGKARPRFPNVNDDSRAHNRRVEIEVEE